MVQEAVTKTIPNKKKAKWLSQENLQIAKRSEKQRMKGKIYPSECRILKRARRHKKAFLSGQCKEIEENNRMGKIMDIFKEIRDTKGIFHATMVTMKNRNAMALTETEDIKKKWQEYTEELYKRGLNDPDNHNDVTAHLKPDTLECGAKWALGSIRMNKASGGNRILAELFQILKDDAVKVLQSICQQICKTQQESCMGVRVGPERKRGPKN